MGSPDADDEKKGSESLFRRGSLASRARFEDDGRLTVQVDSLLISMLSQLMPDAAERRDADELEPPPPYSAQDEVRHVSGRDRLAEMAPMVVNLESSTARHTNATNVPSFADAGPSSTSASASTSSYSKIHASDPRPAASFSLRLNIVIHVVGSRGDVQPFLALGCALKEAGHRVRLATHDVFDGFVRGAGLEFFPVGGDPTELMAYMVRNPGLLPSMASLRDGEVQKKRRMVASMLDGFWRSCIEACPLTGAPFVADAIIANPPSYAHVHCAQALSIPVHLMFTMPWTTTRQFPHPLANLLQNEDSNSRLDTGLINYASYSIMEWMTWQGLGDVVNDWRTRVLELQPVPTSEGPRLTETLQIPCTYCWSPALVPKPRDWPSYVDVCGFFFRNPPKYDPPADLDYFLRTGPAPIYIGFGSIVIDDPDALTQTLLRAIRDTGVRAIISKGWSKLGGDQIGYDELDSNVFFLGDCPHEWLFNHVCAVIHHGGAGTTACGLLHGRPTTVVPFFGDQRFWGEMVAVAGAGPRPIPQKQLTAESLAAAIRFCLSPDAMHAAQQLASKIRMDGGVKQAVASFHKALERSGGYINGRCDLLPSQPAVWRYKPSGSRGRVWNLSKLAAEVLADNLLLERDKLKSLHIKTITIENRRWDPVTATTSSLLSTTKGMLTGATGIVTRPIEAYQVAQDPTLLPSPSPSSSGRAKDTASISSQGSSSRGSGSARASSSLNTTGKMAVASASGVGTLVKHMTKGMLLDMPLAAAEGLRNVPKLYGGDVTRRDNIDGVVSGATVAGRQFAEGMAGGFADLFTQPVKGAREEGALGAAKGFGKGLASFSTKVTSAPLGLVAYSFEGVYQSLRSVGARRPKVVRSTKQAEGIWMWERARVEGWGDGVEKQVLQGFRTGVPSGLH